MSRYALDDLPSLLARLRSPLDDSDPTLRYVCALFAELPYFHVPAFECDDRRRAKVIPSSACRELIRQGRTTDLATLARATQLGEYPMFIVEDHRAIVVGVRVGDILWVGFRGTTFLYDWAINARVELIAVASGFFRHGPFWVPFGVGRTHRGFTEESLRISLKLWRAIHDRGLDGIECLVFAGHSLGGAVAAIARAQGMRLPEMTCVFGTPRYGDAMAHSLSPVRPVIHLRRRGDIVPTLPPRAFGYADPPLAFWTDGPECTDVGSSSTLRDFWRLGQFLSQRFSPHDMAEYRGELGASAGATASFEPLLPVPRL